MVTIQATLAREGKGMVEREMERGVLKLELVPVIPHLAEGLAVT